MNENAKKSWIEDLWDRKVPQYLGTYLAVGFGLLQFLEFITSRYNLESYWVDKYLIIWLALIPAMAILAYFGPELRPFFAFKQLRWPKLLMLTNVVLALFLGGIFFSAGAIEQSEVVEITDEDGNTVQALVPSLQKVKTIACFQFENLTGDETQDWWGVAFSHLLTLNLEQRPEFYAISEYTLNGYYDVLGLPAFTPPSTGMQREIARKARNDYFSRISYDVEEGQFVFKGHLYNTRNGKEIININVTDEDPYAAIDQIKRQIFDKIPDAFKAVENQVYLPASTLVSSNPDALKYFTESRIAFYKNPTGLDKVVSLAQKAVELDPTCSICHFYLGDPLYGQGRREEAITYIKNAIKYGNSLPERMQFRAKSVLYQITDKMDAYLNLQEMRRKMFPFEFEAYQSLLSIYNLNYGPDSAKALLQEAIDYGNVEKGLLALYSLQLGNGEYDEAEQTLKRLSKEFPDRSEDRLKFASIYEKQGRVEEAKQLLVEQETLDPLNMDIQVRLSYLDFKSLNMDEAFERTDEGLQQSTTLVDSLRFLWINVFFAQQMGQINKAIQAINTYEKYQIRRSPINRVVATSFPTKASLYMSIGQSEKVNELLDELAKYSPEYRGIYLCTSNTLALTRGYEMTMTEEEYTSCQQVYRSYGTGGGEYFEVMNSYQKGDYENCLKILNTDDGRIENLFNNSDRFFLAEIYAKAGNREKAKEILLETINQKTDEPRYYYEMAQLIEEEDPKAAKDYLDIALQFWAEADATYMPQQWAKELAGRLGI